SDNENKSRPTGSSSMLHKAVTKNEPLETMKFLVEIITDINQLDNTGKTALDYATKDSEVYYFLKRVGCLSSPQLRLINSMKTEMDEEKIRKVLKDYENEGEDLDFLDRHGNNLLHMATSACATKALIERIRTSPRYKKMLNQVNHNKETPLKSAIQNGVEIRIMQYLVQAGGGVPPQEDSVDDYAARHSSSVSINIEQSYNNIQDNVVMNIEDEEEDEEEEKKDNMIMIVVMTMIIII
ncbi:ankyrin repeat protein, partial [Reticulomyxa filosa]